MSDMVKKGPRTWQEFLNKPPEMMKLALVATAAGIVFMMVPGLFGLKGSSKPPVGATAVAAAPARDGKETEIELLQQRMNRDLETALSRIRGAGEVHVKVSLGTGVTRVPVLNTSRQETTTGEKAADNSQRDQKTTTVTETNVLVQDALAVTKELRPQIVGVLVIAEGAHTDGMRYRLSRAVADHLGIPIHMVDVETSDGGKS
ncbi:MAG TPA: hypothetical protein VNT01_06850 [Symbiobacteriaceae bacterium]|nr:hypothetical protein [Symbiobacteriaceae bacterium]